MAGAALVAGVSTSERYTFAADGRGARRGRRLRLQALDPAPARGERRGGRRLPARRRRRHAGGLRRRPALAGPGRSGSARRRDDEAAASCSAARRCSASASGTNCSRSRPAATTFKLPFGHRGANHPVLDHRSRGVLVTSQNHGFAVAAGDDQGVTHTSLYDGTVEGLDYPELRARSAQFHPEARPARTTRRRSSAAGSRS